MRYLIVHSTVYKTHPHPHPTPLTLTPHPTPLTLTPPPHPSPSPSPLIPQLPIKELKQSKRQRVEIKLVPQGSIEILLEYFSNISAMARKPSLLSSGVFGVPIEIVTQ